MTNFEMWVKGCETNKTELYCIDGDGDTGLYETKSKYLHANNYHYNNPVFHVWIKGKREFCGLVPDSHAAVCKTERRLQRITEWHELTPRCYGILDFLQFNFLRAFSSLPWIGWDSMPEYINMAKRKEYALARKIAWIMAANIKD